MLWNHYVSNIGPIKIDDFTVYIYNTECITYFNFTSLPTIPYIISSLFIFGDS